MFSNKDLRKLLIPLIVEQVLTSFMGTIDTMMVSKIGQAAVSGVSCVDSINKLIIFMLTSIATGGTIVCSQYMGRRDEKQASRAAEQVILCSIGIALILMIIGLVFREGLLRLIFGSVEEDVMAAALDYFLVTLFSYPFVAVFNCVAALYRSTGNSRLPMIVSALGNVLNIAGNYVLLFVVKMGVAGAALSTTVSMAATAIAMFVFIRRKGQVLRVHSIFRIRPDFGIMWRVLKVGVPTGIENSMFQLGKLIVQSTVATLGTMAIASNAIVVALEYVTSMPSQGIAVGLITVAGQCIGAGKLDEAKYYIKKLTLWSTIVLLVWNWAIFALTVPVCNFAGLETAAAKLTFDVMLVISIVKPVCWPLAFLPSNGMRAAGDGTFSMVAASISMWVCRVGLTTLLCRVLGVGLMGIWIGYFADWTVRSIISAIRFKSGRWTRHKVIEDRVKEA